MGSSDSSLKDKHVVIVGGGYGGTELALGLKKLEAKFTLIDMRDCFHHSAGSVRAICVPEYAKKTLIPFELSFGEDFMQGEVTKIEPSKNIVKVRSIEDPKKDETEVKYDILVLATGVTRDFPLKLAYDNREDALKKYERYLERVKESQKIIVVGGGPMGCEVAGEIATEFPDKQVTIIHSKEQLVRDDMTEGFYKKLNQIFDRMKIERILGEKVINLTSSSVGEGLAVLRTDKWTILEANLVIRCTGPKVNSLGYDLGLSSAKDAKGRLKVNEFLQVEGHENIFAIGSCAGTDENKVPVIARAHARVLLENLKRRSKEDPMKPWRLDPLNYKIVLSLGRNSGIGEMKSKIYGITPRAVLGEYVCKNLKGKHLFTQDQWKRMGQTIDEDLKEDMEDKKEDRDEAREDAKEELKEKVEDARD